MVPDLDALVDYFQSLTRESVAGLERHYAPDAYFKDPFNEVTGSIEIQRIFRHMFDRVREPRFIVTERVVGSNGAVLVWNFRFLMRSWQPATAQVVRGVSHLRFDDAGRVVYHRDYWDAAEELYAKLPLLGFVMRALQRALKA